MDSSVEKIRHIYTVAKRRRQRENSAEQLRMMHAIGHAVASLLDKKGAAGYKAAENALISDIEGKAEQDQGANIAALERTLLQAGARRKIVGHGSS